MFGLFKRNYKLVAPVDGKVIDLSEVSDPVFAERMAGEGVAIESTGDIFVAPADGKLTMIFKTNHAFGLTLANGTEILVHIGIDTVALEGEGFERLIEEGKNVIVGEPIIKIDRSKICSKGYSLVTPVLITNLEAVKELKCNIGVEVKAGSDDILSYKTR